MAEPEKLTVTCSNCGRKVRFDARLERRKAKCPGCQAELWLSRHALPVPDVKAATPEAEALEIAAVDTRRLMPSRGWGRLCLAFLGLLLCGECTLQLAALDRMGQNSPLAELSQQVVLSGRIISLTIVVVGYAIYYRLLRLDWSQNGRP